MTDPVTTDTSEDRSAPPSERDPAPDERSLGGARHTLGVLGRAALAIGRFLRRWRAPLVLLPLLAALGYAALLGGRMLWAEVPSSPPTARSVTCWDGSESPRADCPVPEGAAGLQWVFPSFRPNGGRCVEVAFPDNGGPRPTQYDCEARVDGAAVTVGYSQRSTLTRGMSYFAKRYPGVEPKEQAGGERLLYRDAAPRADGTFEVTVSYTKYPYAVTVSAASLALADAGLDELVQFRPSAFILSRPAER